MLALYLADLVRAARDRRRPPRLCGRQQPGGGAPDRHPDAAAAARRLHRRRPVYGIAALLVVARTGVGDPNAGQTENLDSITAVVLGGTSLFGGRGTIIGTLSARSSSASSATASADRRGVGLPDSDHRHPGDSRGRRSTSSRVAGTRTMMRKRRRHDTRSWRRAGSSSATATSPRWTAPTSSSTRRDPGGHRRQRRRQVDARSRRCRARSFPTRARFCSTASRCSSSSPLDARRHGIETVYQDLAVAPAHDHRREHVPRPRDPPARPAGHRASACSTSDGCAHESGRPHADSRSASVRCGRRWRRSPAVSGRASRWRAARRSRGTS